MIGQEKQLRRIRDKRCKNVKFDELCSLVESYGFELDRTRGSHHIYKYPRFQGIVNIQKPHHGSDVQPRICKQALDAVQEVIEYFEE